MDAEDPDDPNTGTPQKRPAPASPAPLKRCKPEMRLSDKRLRGLRALDSKARILTLVDLMYHGYEVIANADEEKDRLAALRVMDSLIKTHQAEGQYVGKQQAEMAEKLAAVLKENEALKRGSGVLVRKVPKRGKGDQPVH